MDCTVAGLDLPRGSFDCFVMKQIQSVATALAFACFAGMVVDTTAAQPGDLLTDLITTTRVEQPQAPTNRLELFNGKDFDGFVFTSRSSGNQPSETWIVTNGVIHCTGKTIGYLRTEKSLRDYKLMVEWRFLKVAPKADNTGVLVHMQLPDKVWPQCVQVQGKHDRQGDLFLMAGAESKEHRGLDANTALPLRGESVEKPVGEWNTSMTLCSSNVVKAYINDRLMNEATECTVSSGFIGIQSEGADFEIRKMFVEPLN